jgi:hypothetical protein
LWQINLKAHPDLAGENLLDPQTNANAAYMVYSAAGSTFQPWTTFKTGKYLASLGVVNQVIGAVAPVVASSDGTDGTDGTGLDTVTVDTGSGISLGIAAGAVLALWAAFEFFG